MEKIDEKKEEIKQDLKRKRLIFENALRRKDLIVQEQKEIEKNNSIIKQNNEGKVKSYKDTLNVLNKGQFSTEQLANETDNEYLSRLRNNAEIEVPKEQYEDMAFLINQKFRKSMKTLLRNNVIIEQVINSLKETKKMI